MPTPSEPPGATVTVHLELTILGQPVRGDIEMPAAPIPLTDMLPVFQSLAEVVVDRAVSAVEAEGKHVSCKKGCGACCRQLVPIAEAEARRLRTLVDDLPEPHRSAVRARFAEARRRLEDAGMWDTLQKRDEWGSAARRPIGLDYFALKVACPFLEEESCSIHPDRPLACREYLVTSPAENCAHPSAETVDCVKLPARLWPAVALFDEVPPGQETIRWVPLVMALDWADAHPEEPAPRPGVEFLGAFIERLTGSALPPLPDTTPL